VLREGDELPIIFLTAADSTEDRLAGFDAGGDDYLVKPFVMAETACPPGSILTSCFEKR
jgi:two-component system, OmpR family, response regulator